MRSRAAIIRSAVVRGTAGRASATGGRGKREYTEGVLGARTGLVAIRAEQPLASAIRAALEGAKTFERGSALLTGTSPARVVARRESRCGLVHRSLATFAKAQCNHWAYSPES